MIGVSLSARETSGLSAYLAKILRVLERLGLVVAILVDLGDKDLAEQRITLTAYLLEELLVAITVVIEKTREGAAGRCIYAGDFGASECR